MAAEEHDPAVSPQPDDDNWPGQGADGVEAGRETDPPACRPEDEASWLGCLWLIVVPGIILGAVIVALNWLGC
jgi:hypothetical protein